MIYILIIILIISIFAMIMMASLIVGLIRTGGVPFISTNKKDFDEICKSAELKPGEIIYDLGCGKANFLVRAAKKFGAKGRGYELALWPYTWARISIRLNRADVKVYMQDFFKLDLRDADVVFCYLFPEVMAKLESKFEKELKPGARVVSYGFKLPNRKPDKEVITNDDNVELGRIHVYKY